MHGPIWAVMLALACCCYGLPGSRDISRIPQAALGEGKDFNRVSAACVQPALESERDRSKGGLEGDVRTVGCDVEQSHSALSQDAHHSLIIEDNDGWFYFTDIAVGDPPQSFRASVDISWSDFFVPSVGCEELDCSHHRLYNHSQSTSYQENGTAVHMHYAGFYTSGYASTDILRVGDLIIENQSFEEATLLRPVPLWDDIFDSVLGLARLPVNDEESSMRAVSPFHNMIRQGLLQKNLFSLKLSEMNANITGELLLGEINNDLYTGNLTSFPVSTAYSTDYKARYFLAPGWQVDAHSVAYEFDGKPIKNFSLAGYAAAFATAYPYIDLPREIGVDILEYLGVDVLNLVECDRRDSMPDLIFNLGHDGVPFILKPYDYIRKHPKWEWSETCQVEITVHDEPEDGTKYIALGSVFLARWYSIFDYDKAQISFGTLSRK